MLFSYSNQRVSNGGPFFTLIISWKRRNNVDIDDSILSNVLKGLANLACKLVLNTLYNNPPSELII